MTLSPPSYIILYRNEARWKQHRAFSSHTAALECLHSLMRRFPSYEVEMVRADERVTFSEHAPIPDDAMELVE